MAWWRKRPATRAKGFDGATRREQRSAAIPAPRAEVKPQPQPGPRSGPDEQWDLIKRDLIALDPEFFDDIDGIDDSFAELDRLTDGDRARLLSDERITASLRRLNIRYLVDEAGALLAMWERHVVQIRREGPAGEILVLRARAYATLPADWNDRAFRAANEWNRTRRFLKAYVGEPTESGAVPLYGEIQLPLRPGVPDDLLDEFIDCAAAVSGAYVDWLHGEAAVL